MLIDSFDVLGGVLVRIVNKSLSSGSFPNSWKESTVTPIAKVKNSTKCEEYRPVNSLPTYEKVLERLVYNQLMKYLEENSLIISNQSGFRRGHSCETALNMVMVDWKEQISLRNKIACVFLDFKRAFETVDHQLLLQKMSKYGIRGKELKWFREFLTGRTQRTKVGQAISSAVSVDIGVPQGSVLGTLMFSLYINDISKVVKHAKVALFADDTLIYIAGRDVNEIESLLQEDLSELSEWLKANKLKLNVAKTKSLLINGEGSLNLCVEGAILETVKEIKYLGIVIDKDLKFAEHIEYIIKKIAKKVDFLRRIRKNISTYTAINVYNSIVRPHFEYCSTILFMGGQRMLQKLQTLQNKAMRIILKCNRYTPILLMLETLKWLSVRQRISMNVFIFIFKMKNNILPEYWIDQVNYVRDVQPYRLRSANDFRLPPFRNAGAQNSVMFRGLRMFNDLPTELKCKTNFRIFKKNIISYVKERM